MKAGDKLREKYTNRKCVVKEVCKHHMVLWFQEGGASYVINEDNYKYYVRRRETVVND